jgi:hypothetical protein
MFTVLPIEALAALMVPTALSPTFIVPPLNVRLLVTLITPVPLDPPTVNVPPVTESVLLIFQ